MMAANAIEVKINFDGEAFDAEFRRRAVLISASRHDELLEQMINDISRFIYIGEKPDVLDAEILELTQ